ncbi:MAG: response regulator transcription factor [Clostridiales bacterium]|nr:response regulator transcription factor [Candidatus Equinaster intestinalis]
MYKLFIVEDDTGIAAGIRDLAVSWGFEVTLCSDFSRVTEEFAACSPHIVLLDIGLPFFNGYHWCGEIRKVSNVPIVFISSAADNMNIVMAMNMGADDFIVKPFDSNVLVAKLQAILRRSYDFSASAPLLVHNGALLNTGDETLSFNDEKIELTKNEYRILRCLIENKGKVISREKLMQRLWETDSFVDDNTLTVNINRLRKKLDAAGLEGFITTKFGVGYVVE